MHPGDQPRRRLKVDISELAMAFDESGWEISYYLNLDTGEVVPVMDNIRRQLEGIYEEYWDESVEEIDLPAVLADLNMPQWEKGALLEADKVEAGYGKRYISIPKAESHEGYDDMQAFIITVRDLRLRNRLEYAIGGRRPFRAFKDELLNDPVERERWFEFKDARMEKRILEWLDSEGIDPIIEAAAEIESAPSPPPVRTRMIAEVLDFVLAARKIPGVTRVALIGSLATGKPQPKDADLLVTVTGETDLTPLATLGRKLAGHLQSLNRGGEVFLVDPANDYLGRTCPWKRCGPGIRSSCDARHCGQRLYLHDDLEEIRLAKELVAQPPIELWPRIVTRVTAPEDLQKELLEPLERAYTEKT